MRKITTFVAMRMACAVITYGAYLLLLLLTNYKTAYVISYVFGIAIAYVASAKLVFRQPMNRHSALSFPLVYVVQFILGFFIVEFLVEWLQVPAWLALAISVVVTLPLTYIMSRWAVHKQPDASP